MFIYTAALYILAVQVPLVLLRDDVAIAACMYIRPIHQIVQTCTASCILIMEWCGSLACFLFSANTVQL